MPQPQPAPTTPGPVPPPQATNPTAPPVQAPQVVIRDATSATRPPAAVQPVSYPQHNTQALPQSNQPSTVFPPGYDPLMQTDPRKETRGWSLFQRKK